MKNNDVELIHRILDGDDTAFSSLVGKYQKQVHALAWRKIGDFHIAEEITQDTFLKAYQNLATLKKPHRFAGWLYVIATHCCHAWLRKKRIQTESLEELDSDELEPEAYSRYVAEQEAKAIAETQRQVVKKLLATLPESERTVITLHYFGEMTCEKISEFLGVSANTIKSRLRRARNRLKKEEPMIREAISNFQISPNLTENIMKEIARLKPGAPTGGKPLVPWAIAASSVVLIVLMLGIGSQYLARFQKPYTLDAQSEMTVELVDAPIVRNLEVKPDIQNRLGSSNALSERDSIGQKPDEVLLAAAQAEGEDDVSVSKQQWIQSAPLAGTMVEGLLATDEEELYTLADGHIYKWQDDSTGWQHVSDISSITDVPFVEIPMAKWDNTLYILPSHELYSSEDDGKTWDIIHEFPKKYNTPKELLLMQHAFYIVFETHGAFRSEDKGKTWENINEEFPTKPYSIVSVQDTVFTAAGSKIYRWDSGSWQRLVEFPVPEASNLYSITATNNKLYAFVINHRYDPDKLSEELQRGWWIFRSTDLGNSWKNITPTHVWKSRAGWLINVRLVAAGDTLMAIEQGMVRSTDGGDTWMPLQTHGISPSMFSNSPAAALSQRIFYFGSWDYGLQRSTDGGNSWDVVNVTSNKGGISNLIVYKEENKGQNILPIIYGNVGNMVKTANKGKSWKTIPTEMPITTWDSEDPPHITQIVKSGGVIYAKGSSSLISSFSKEKIRIYRESTDGNTLVPIQEMPIFDPWIGSQLSQRKPDVSDKSFVEQLQERFSGATQFFIQLAQMNPTQQYNLRRFGLRGAFAVSDDTFYTEYNFKLFRWKPGDTEWYDTELEETVELSLHTASRSLKLAVSGDTVYVGKRDDSLVVSFDKGTNWIDLTPALPFPVSTFKEIVVAGSTVYVATDAGIITSDDGRNWRAIIDTEGSNPIMDILAVDGTTLYGVTKNTGIYQLENDTWKQIVSEIPEGVNSLAVDGNTLYVGTNNRGMLHFNLEK